jgi:predicted DNA-binding transcriptional regulator AlpA
MPPEFVAAKDLCRIVVDLSREIERLARKVRDLENQPWMHPKDVMATMGISKATLYRYLKCGKLPRPSHIYGPVWRRCDLDKHQAARTRPAQRRQR